MMLMGYLCGGWTMVRMAKSALEHVGQGEGDLDFYNAKVMTARFYCAHLLPRINGLLETVTGGSESVMLLPETQF